jgi:hypothetical protein
MVSHDHVVREHHGWNTTSSKLRVITTYVSKHCWQRNKGKQAPMESI